MAPASKERGATNFTGGRDRTGRRRAGKYFPLALVVSIGIAVSLAVLAAVQGWERAQAELRLERRAQAWTAAIEKAVASDLEILYSVRALFEVSPLVNARAFGHFVRGSLLRNSNIHALSWNRRVPGTQRTRYEAAGRPSIAADFQITELDASGRLVRARARHEYVSVLYIEPRKTNETALGYDILSDPLRREALLRATSTGAPAATGKIRLLQAPANQFDFLIVMPVYCRRPQRQTVAEKCSGIQGFVVGAFRIGDTVRASLIGLDTDGIVFRISDEADPSREPFFELGQSGQGERGRGKGDVKPSCFTTVNVAGRRWSLSFGSGSFTRHFHWAEWSTLAIGLTITAILATHVHMTSRQAAALRRMSRRLVETQEAERRRLACELHDEIGQALGALKMNLQRMHLRGDASGDDPFLDDSVGIVDSLVQQVRSLALNLRPSLLDDFGLVPAVCWYLERQAERSGIVADIVHKGARDRLPTEIETTCFRVVQEAMTNITRHARAKHVKVELAVIEATVRLTIEDDGVGFDVAAARHRAARGGSFGILGMEERVMLAGGRLELDSVPGRGTIVRAHFPLAAALAGGEGDA